ncbi:MAG: hypothetical protein CSA60_04505 [Neptuniibacter caesariensis]|uniref:Roadblock/LAMTOR2 domain-containing protein n=1 Tax=Neptuniibacter caesariensis TaxID=207954 RepID=A0A2G6JIV0_NEPCE|nr:MAG: hypothetical protein CSA60_04505 [Neptuniibacter caesariensis]
MSDLLKRLDKPGVIACSCVVQGNNVKATSFPKELKNYETIGRQAFGYVFQNVAKHHAKHNESHLEIGDKRLSGFQLKPGLLLISLSRKDTNIMLVRQHIHEIHRSFIQRQAKKNRKT